MREKTPADRASRLRHAQELVKMAVELRLVEGWRPASSPIHCVT